MSQDNQKLTFDLHQEKNVPMIAAFGEKIYAHALTLPHVELHPAVDAPLGKNI
jgi:hypothetical protein